MKTKILIIVIGLAWSPLTIQLQAEENRNRFSLGPRFGFNIKADFRDVTVPTNPAPLAGAGAGGGPGTIFQYQDGFVGVDGSGNAGNLTWFWGYEHAGQVDMANDRILMSGVTSDATGRARNASDDPQFGLELIYQRHLGRSERSAWGLEAAFGWSDVRISTTGLRTTDAFALGGIVPPSPPYRGTVAGPGPLIGDVPTRGVTATGHRLEADLYGWRLGPYFELELPKRTAISFGAGLALGYVVSDYSFTESGNVGGLPTAPRSGSSSRDQLRAGGYGEVKLGWALSDRWGLFTSAQYQNLGQFNQNAAGKRARLDLRNTVFWTVGASVSF